MALEGIFKFRNLDSSENINARLEGLLTKGIVQGGVVVPEPASLQVRIKASVEDGPVLLAYTSTGMLVRERYEEHVLSVQAGTTNVIVLRAAYREAEPPLLALESMSLSNYNADPDKDLLVRLCSVIVDIGDTIVPSEAIDLSFRDQIEGFSRGIVRAVVDEVADLPPVSGSPAVADINFIKNTFASGTYVNVNTGTVSENFYIVPAISFRIGASSVPGFSRINPSSVPVSTVIQVLPSGIATVTTTGLHSLSIGQTVRISNNSAPQANGLHVVTDVPTGSTFEFLGTIGVLPFSGTGGTVVDTSTASPVIAKLAPGILHTITPGNNVIITGASDTSFNGTHLVTGTPDAVTFLFNQTGFPSADSGNGVATKQGFVLPVNGVEIGESGPLTAQRFEEVFNASSLSLEINASAIGSSVQLEAKVLGEDGNAFLLTKVEPGVTVGDESLVIADFDGGQTPLPGTSHEVIAGDLYVVLNGELGEIEIWGFDGTRFRNLTSGTTATSLDFHRRNLFLNEKHLTENEKLALTGSVGTPSATNRFVTQEDMTILTSDTAAALAGADGVIPSGTNRFLTEARIRGERSDLEVPSGQNWVQLPVGQRWIVGQNTTTDTTQQYVNVVFTSSLLEADGPREYVQSDFTPLRVTGVFTDVGLTTPLNYAIAPYDVDLATGLYPRLDADVLSLPQNLWVEFSDIPDNGSATLLYSQAVPERTRIPTRDMRSGPQTITPATLLEVQNRSQELRYAGASVTGTTLTFPAGLFSASNLQGYTFRRPRGVDYSDLSLGFSINFETGTGTVGIVNSFTPINFTTEVQTQKWTQYYLVLRADDTIDVVHIKKYLSVGTKSAFGTTLSLVDKASTPVLTDGGLVFAVMGVQGEIAGGVNLEDLDLSSLAMFPYQKNSQLGEPIVCGDGTSSTGMFSGTDAFQRALAIAQVGDTIYLRQGTYSGLHTISIANLTVRAESGVTLENTGATCISVNAAGFRLQGVGFTNCSVGLNLLAGAHGCKTHDLTFSSSVTTKVQSSVTLTGTQLLNKQATFARWTVSDGTSSSWVGDYNSATAIQAVHDDPLVAPGDVIVVYPGTYDDAVLTKSDLVWRGFGAGCIIDASGGATCLVVTGSRNTFEGLTFANAATGIDLQTTALLNNLGSSLKFDVNVVTPVRFPLTVITKHGNYYSGLSGKTSGEVTVGDGTLSWGDYVGPASLQLALANEPAGTKITVGKGTFSLVSGTFARMLVEGSGRETIIQGNASTDNIVLEIIGSSNTFRGFFLEMVNHSAKDFEATGINIQGNDNFLEDIEFEVSGPTRIEPHRRYSVTTGIRNRFMPRTGAPTGDVSWTVGDGIHSFGDFNGTNGIIAALNDLPTRPRGLSGDFTAAAGSSVDFENTGVVSPFEFVVEDIFRFVTISTATNPTNVGTFQITALLTSQKVTLQRVDGVSFINELGMTWDLLVGARIWVLPGTYDPFVVSSTRNDVELDAWGDVIITADGSTSPVIEVNGNRNRIRGFRLEGSVPITGVGFEVNGKNNIISDCTINTAIRYDIGANASGNQIRNGDEYDHTRTFLTVGVQASRADFVGDSQTSIQAAVDRAASDPHIKTIFLGAGNWTLTSTVNITGPLVIRGAGYDTHLVGDGTFAAITLAGGNNTVEGIRFDNFTNSLAGTQTGNFVRGNWLVSAPIAAGVTGSTSDNL